MKRTVGRNVLALGAMLGLFLVGWAPYRGEPAAMPGAASHVEPAGVAAAAAGDLAAAGDGDPAEPLQSCPDYSGCLRISAVQGTSCGSPNSLTFTVTNACAHAVGAKWCSYLPSGGCGDCKAWPLGPGETTQSFTCHTTGSFIAAGTDASASACRAALLTQCGSF